MELTENSFRVVVTESANCPKGAIWLPKELQNYAANNGYKTCTVFRYPMIEKCNTVELEIVFLKPEDRQYCVISTADAHNLEVDIDSGGDVLTIVFGDVK